MSVDDAVEEALTDAARAILSAPEVSLACHVSPDGDALGSMLAMHHLCRSVGKPSVASWPEPFVVAPHYTFLPGLDAVTKPADFPEAPALMLTFDCGSLGRLGDLEWQVEVEPNARPSVKVPHLLVGDHRRRGPRLLRPQTQGTAARTGDDTQ